MESFETKILLKKSKLFKHNKNTISVTSFLGHEEDKINVQQKTDGSREIEIISNGETLFIGTKWELYKLLKKYKNENNG